MAGPLPQRHSDALKGVGIMNQLPTVNVGLVASSRGNFPRDLAIRRREELAALYEKEFGPIYQCPILLVGEQDVKPVLQDLREHGVNTLALFLGNFGPEIPESLLAQQFDGPIVLTAAAEETKGGLFTGRGDAYCGMLNASYNLGIREVKVHIPRRPVGTARQTAKNIAEFLPAARCLLGLRRLKIITFGPRPNDFVACNAPIQPLFSLGVEIEENSELDLYQAFLQHSGDPRIPQVAASMEQELGGRSQVPGALPRLAQYELTLLDWMEQHRGDSEYVVFANRCWPAFEAMFGFVPCYVNGRLTGRGIPVSCEVDVYGALSEFIGACITQEPVSILDINNTVPEDLYREEIAGKYPDRYEDLFMGFHCGNAPVCRMVQPQLERHKILSRNLGEGEDPSITEGTIEGRLTPGEATIFRLQADASGRLRAYAAEGKILDVPCHSFGSIGIFSIPELERFYRYGLLEHQYPHHCAVAFQKVGSALFQVFRYLGVKDIDYNRPAGERYPEEDPFARD